jgi:hypothetical protein
VGLAASFGQVHPSYLQRYGISCRYRFKELIPVAVRSKAWVCGCSLTRVVVSNITGGMDVCLL